MKYHSTRDLEFTYTFSEAILKGLAHDGGLIVPEYLPSFDMKDFQDQISYTDLSKRILESFLISDILYPDIQEICEYAFDFDVPLKKIDDQNYLLELFHGPTAAFKDFGARFLATCLSKINQKNGADRPTRILVATSGDTGGAVASAFFKQKGTEVIILYPHDRVSKRQEKQLTCWGDNIFSYAIEGVFDDCQRIVKEIFHDNNFTTKYNISSANSINIGRILPQVFYYAYASILFYRENHHLN